MNGQLRLNVILPIVLFAALAAAVGLFMLSRGPAASTASTDSALAPLPRVVAPKPVATTKPAPKPAAVKPKAKPARPKITLKAGLPPALKRALTAESVAVVSLVTPDATLDELAAKEAAAGARAAGASFLTVDVGNERSARPFALELGVLEAPTVLVYKRPGDLFVRLDGFVDLDTVAQAADNAGS